MNKEAKQVLVVRKDLNMRKGKIVAQCSHASMGCILNYASNVYDGQIQINVEKPAMREWLTGRFKKITVYVESETELMEIYQAAIDNNINVKLITDAGLTEFNGVPTKTCLGLGPDYPDVLDTITGHLKLL
jgi:PTH2 family peptidyl-tRNA hydrolase